MTLSINQTGHEVVLQLCTQGKQVDKRLMNQLERGLIGPSNNQKGLFVLVAVLGLIAGSIFSNVGQSTDPMQKLIGLGYGAVGDVAAGLLVGCYFKYCSWSHQTKKLSIEEQRKLLELVLETAAGIEEISQKTYDSLNNRVQALG